MNRIVRQIRQEYNIARDKQYPKEWCVFYGEKHISTAPSRASARWVRNDRIKRDIIKINDAIISLQKYGCVVMMPE